MAYDAKKIYYRFDDHLSRLVLDYEASRQISSESESLYHGLPTDPYDEGLFVEHNVKRGLRNADGSGVVGGSYPHLGRARLQQDRRQGRARPGQAHAARLQHRGPGQQRPGPRTATATKRSPICSLRALCPLRESSTAFVNVWALLGI